MNIISYFNQILEENFNSYLKNYFTHYWWNKKTLLVRGLKTFEDNGYTDRSKLTEEEDTLNYFLYLECLSFTRNCANMINSDLKEETKIDLIVNEFVNCGIEELYKSMYEDK